MVQKTRVIRTRKKAGSESSPYWDWVHNQAIVKQKDDNREWEPVQANPDRLASDEGLHFEAPPATVEMVELIREALVLLSPQQRRVVEMMAEGKSTRDAANELAMKHSTLVNHLNRARKKVQEYVAQNTDSGR